MRVYNRLTGQTAIHYWGSFRMLAVKHRELAGAASYTGAMNLTLPGSPESVSIARHAVSDVARESGADVDNVATAVTEAVGNAVLHGCARLDSDTCVRVEVGRDDHDLVVSVADDGPGLMPSLERAGIGAGLALIGAMADEVTYESSGRGLRVTMRFPCQN